MTESVSYKPTIIACYIGNFTQAIVTNITPILFIPLREQFGISYAQFGLLILINFLTQVMVDIAFSRAVDKYGFRPFAVGAHIICVIGFLLFALTPVLFPKNEFIGFMIATVIFAGSGGLLELLLSPIIDSIPSKEKEKAMALLHSFYAWGQVTVVVFTTIAIFLGLHWSLIISLWIIVPFINLFLFRKVPLTQKLHESQIMKIRKLIRTPVFLIAFFAIVFGGASEVIMAQWTSSYMQKGLALPKLVGDILGMCGFAVFLGIGRLLYGLYGEKFDLSKVLIYGSLIAILCYIVVAVSPYTWLSVAACIITGLCVSLLWPGTLIVASSKLPLAGASMFALLAAGGDIGASIGPWLTGIVTDITIKLSPVIHGITAEQVGLRAGILLAAVFPLLSLLFHLILKKQATISK